MNSFEMLLACSERQQGPDLNMIERFLIGFTTDNHTLIPNLLLNTVITMGYYGRYTPNTYPMLSVKEDRFVERD